MGTSYNQPTDRPSKIWCRTCQKYLSMESEKVGGCRWPPENVSTWAHGSCAHGAMVYVFDDVVPETPKSLTASKPKWTPQCGNPECDGTCGDLRCIPPQPIAKVEEKPKDIMKKTSREVLTALFCAGMLFGMALLTFIMYATGHLN